MFGREWHAAFGAPRGGQAPQSVAAGRAPDFDVGSAAASNQRECAWRADESQMQETKGSTDPDFFSVLKRPAAGDEEKQRRAETSNYNRRASEGETCLL